MASKRESDPEPERRRRPPAKTPKAREDQLIAMANDLAEEQLRNGTASAQVVTHYLKLGSSRERIEQERMAMEVELLRAKRDQIASQKKVEALYGKALNAMRAYSGQAPLEEDDDDD